MKTHFLRLIFLSAIISSCGTLKPIENAVPIRDAREIEGRYKNVSSDNPDRSYHNLSSIIDFRDKTGMVQASWVDIKILDDDELEFLFGDNAQNAKRYKSGYRLKDGKVMLKNKNFRLTGIPYLLGGYKVNKTALGKNPNGDLVLSAVQVDEGAILFIFPASTPKSNFQNTYSKTGDALRSR